MLRKKIIACIERAIPCGLILHAQRAGIEQVRACSFHLAMQLIFTGEQCGNALEWDSILLEAVH